MRMSGSFIVTVPVQQEVYNFYIIVKFTRYGILRRARRIIT